MAAHVRVSIEEAGSGVMATTEVTGEAQPDFDLAMDLVAEYVPGKQAEKAKQVRGASFCALKALVESQDPQLQRTGLETVRSKADNTLAWVSEPGRGRDNRSTCGIPRKMKTDLIYV